MSLSDVAPSSLPARIVLTGFMGCGKTTLGKRLAKHLHYRFIDTDARIEQQSGLTIPEFFESHGEAAFRELERSVLLAALEEPRCVIATGGGALVRQDNLDAALATSTVVYIQLPKEELLERVLFSPKDRPLIDVADPHEVVEALFEARQPFYQQAPLHLNTFKLKPQEAVDALLQLMA